MDFSDFLSLSGIELELTADRSRESIDRRVFQEQLIRNFGSLDPHHQQAGIWVLQDVDDEALREFVKRHVDHSQIDVRFMARIFFQRQVELGYLEELPVWAPEPSKPHKKYRSRKARKLRWRQRAEGV